MITEAIIEKLRLVQIPGHKWNKEKKDFDEVMVHPTVILRDNLVIVSAEDGHYFADYYGEFRGGYPWIHEVLEAFAKEHKCFWEWENAACICLFEA